IAGVPCWIIYHGQVMAGPTVTADPLGDREIVILIKDEKGVWKVISVDEKCVYRNLDLQCPINAPLYEARFFEIRSGEIRVPHRIFFNTEPTPEQILPFIPENLRKNPDPEQEEIGASRETKVIS